MPTGPPIGVMGTLGGCGIGAELTVTVTDDCLVVPVEEVAVAIYVVVDVGETDLVPDGVATEPIPLSICIEVAFVDVQESVLEFPVTITRGLAVKLIVGMVSPPPPPPEVNIVV